MPVHTFGTLDQVRDSKNPTGPVLRGNIAALIHAAQAADFVR